MKIANTIEEVREIVNGWKAAGLSIGLVPTMGFLHEGHTSLMKIASENDRVVVSIFLNPIQFGPKEDLSSYPKDFESDRAKCESNGVDLIFAPDALEMYDEMFSTYVDMTGLTEELCGLSRPGHFRGVCTVVSKLFNIISPDKAYFGEKDAQQLAVVKRMVKDLNFNLEVVGCPIIREPDGLAMSSRNTYLNESQRKAAVILSKSIKIGKELVMAGEKDSSEVISQMKAAIESEPLARIDYIKVVDSNSLVAVDRIDGPVLVAIAVFIGTTRLIDNFSYMSST